MRRKLGGGGGVWMSPRFGGSAAAAAVLLWRVLLWSRPVAGSSSVGVGVEVRLSAELWTEGCTLVCVRVSPPPIPTPSPPASWGHSPDLGVGGAWSKTG